MSQNDSPTSTDSAKPVQQKFQLDLNGVEIEYTEVKCPNCKVPTPTQWVQIPVGTDDPEIKKDPLSLLGLRKRLTLCQNCGNLRLVK